MRLALGLAHRWAGLFIAVFLAISGFTGAIISWDHELDEWLNPDLFETKSVGPTLDPLELVRSVEASDPKVEVVYFPTTFEPGHTALLGLGPRLDPKTGRPFELDYNQVYVDPVTGEHVGKRLWGKISLSRQDLLPFLYKLHFSMHIPEIGGIDRFGFWFMGIIAIVWTIDCLVGFYLTLPQRRQLQAGVRGPHGRSWWERWKPAWRIKRGADSYRLNLDLHRAFGLWLWVLLFVVAFSSISMNLSDLVVRPLVSAVADLTPDPFDDRTPLDRTKQIPAQVSRAQILDIGAKEAQARGWPESIKSVYYGRSYGLYSVTYALPGDDHGAFGMQKRLFFDGADGAVVGGRVPWEGTAGDVFMQLQFPLHSGRIAGIPGRVAISLLGFVVALLSVTGIVVWAKKRAARQSAVSRRQIGVPQAAE